MDINAKIAQAKQREQEKGRPSKVVTVSLDADVSDRLAELRKQLEDEKQKPQDARLTQTSPLVKLVAAIDEVEAEYADTLIDLKFTRLIGSDWSELVTTNPPRDDSIADMHVFGYNFHAVTRAATLRSGAVVEEDGDHTLTEQQWNDLFALLDGGAWEKISNAVYALNEGDSSRAVELGKAQRAAATASETKSVSPAGSASPTGGSSAGNRSKKSRTTTPTTDGS